VAYLYLCWNCTYEFGHENSEATAQRVNRHPPRQSTSRYNTSGAVSNSLANGRSPFHDFQWRPISSEALIGAGFRAERLGPAPPCRDLLSPNFPQTH